MLVSATKGLEADTLCRMSEVIARRRAASHPVVVLSGPSFAVEVARQMPTALVAASTDARAMAAVQEEFRGPCFRLYGSTDVAGVEIGAALKNVIAIAAGVVEGLGLGHNALAALITRGLAEISRLACAVGGRRETLAGLSGLGDLVLTCTGALSRNRHVGIELGRGRPLAEILAGHEDGRRRRADDGRGARAGRAPRRRAADRHADGRRARRPDDGARRRRRADAAPAACRGGWDLGQLPMTSLLSRFKSGLAQDGQQIRERLGEAARVARGGAAASRQAPVLETVEALEERSSRPTSACRPPSGSSQAVRQGGSRSLQERVAAEVRRMLADVAVAAGDEHPPDRRADRRRQRHRQDDDRRQAGEPASVRAGNRSLICAADTFRAAAVEQLEIWAARAGVDIIRAQAGADPAAVVFDAISSGKARGRDMVIVDTAGRLHTRANLMTELDKIRRVVAREVPGAPHEVLLVLDATVGQNGLVQAREFMAAGGVNGIVLTKLDGTAKGGVAVAIAHDLRLPIRYVGVGERLDDLVPFAADEYVDALFKRSGSGCPRRRFMERALFWAERGRGRTSPNPMVGAVVVSDDGVVVGQGAHLQAGGPHAEVHALDAAGPRRAARRSTARSSRAATSAAPARASSASSAAGIARVVAAVEDPNPSCGGQGFAYLREHGIAVRVGPGARGATRQNAPFFTWIQRRRPFVMLKAAVSADGFVGRVDRRVRLTGPVADRWFQRQRAEVDAIAVGRRHGAGRRSRCSRRAASTASGRSSA